jgi:hypothetical protein
MLGVVIVKWPQGRTDGILEFMLEAEAWVPIILIAIFGRRQ